MSHDTSLYSIHIYLLLTEIMNHGNCSVTDNYSHSQNCNMVHIDCNKGHVNCNKGHVVT
jgi:hypothetical protein